MNRTKHLTLIFRSSYPVELGNLPNFRIRIERVNPIRLKFDLTITLIVFNLFALLYNTKKL